MDLNTLKQLLSEKVNEEGYELVSLSFASETLSLVVDRIQDIDMDAIVDSTKLIYTMLEMVNTTNMVNVDAKFIQDYLESIA